MNCKIHAVRGTHSSFHLAAHRSLAIFLAAIFLLALATTASAQKKKKKDDSSSQQPSPAANIPDEQKIDYMISEMLGAWQVGDVEKLHKAYSDDVSVVNGLWAPPLIGWSNYLLGYQQQRARAQQVRLDRLNTLIRVAPSGNVAWACYQWDFAAIVDGNPTSAQGQTTLVLEKRSDNNWVIVHNHTSLVQSSQPAAPGAIAPATPAPAAKP
jgi:ketosteroid isomerase-like protein